MSRQEHPTGLTVEITRSYVSAIVFLVAIRDLNLSHGSRVSKGCRWNSPLIPYELSADVARSGPLLTVLETAMKTWEENTCIRFVEAEKDDEEILWIENETAACDANIGTCSMEDDAATGRRFNRLSVGRCILSNPKWIVHELGHVIGLIHQHMRHDRDSHVSVVWPSIRSKSFHRNFRRLKTYPTLGVKYDLFSIMHYSRAAFAKRGETTLRVVNNARQDAYGKLNDEAACLQDLLGGAFKPSFYDVLFVNRLYECEPKCSKEAVEDENNDEHDDVVDGVVDHPDCYLAPRCQRLCPENWRNRICQRNSSKHGKHAQMVLMEGNFAGDHGIINLHDRKSEKSWPATSSLVRQGVAYNDMSRASVSISDTWRRPLFCWFIASLTLLTYM